MQNGTQTFILVIFYGEKRLMFIIHFISWLKLLISDTFFCQIVVISLWESALKLVYLSFCAVWWANFFFKLVYSCRLLLSDSMSTTLYDFLHTFWTPIIYYIYYIIVFLHDQRFAKVPLFDRHSVWLTLY